MRPARRFESGLSIWWYISVPGVALTASVPALKCTEMNAIGSSACAISARVTIGTRTSVWRVIITE